LGNGTAPASPHQRGETDRVGSDGEKHSTSRKLAERGAWRARFRHPDASFPRRATGRAHHRARADPALVHREISKFSASDAAAYPRYEAMLERVARLIVPTLAMTPPDLLRPRARDLWCLLALGRSFRRLGGAASEAVEVLTGSAASVSRSSAAGAARAGAVRPSACP